MSVRLGQEVQEVPRRDAVDVAAVAAKSPSSPQRTPLVVEERQLAEVRPSLGSTASHSDLGRLPPPPPEFVPAPSDSVVLLCQRGDELVAVAAFAPAAVHKLGRVVLIAARVGPLVRIASSAADEAVFRAILDYFVFPQGRADVVVFLVRDATHVDVLWRLGLALECRLKIEEQDGLTSITLLRPRAVTQAQSLVRSAPRTLLRGLRSLVPSVTPNSDASQELITCLLRLDATLPRVVAPAGLEFEEITVEEARRRPLWFGMGLSATLESLERRRHFVGRLDGSIVFRMVASDHPQVIRALLSSLSGVDVAQPLLLVSNCSTASTHRGRRIYPAALQWLALQSAEAGYKTLALQVQPSNSASLKGASHAGFLRIDPLDGVLSHTLR
jgi:hypothetical protein